METKIFRGPSDLHDFEQAPGQFYLSGSLLRRSDPDRRLWLAAPEVASLNTLQESIVRPAIEAAEIEMIVFQPREERIVEWTR